MRGRSEGSREGAQAEGLPRGVGGPEAQAAGARTAAQGRGAFPAQTGEMRQIPRLGDISSRKETRSATNVSIERHMTLCDVAQLADLSHFPEFDEKQRDYWMGPREKNGFYERLFLKRKGKCSRWCARTCLRSVKCRGTCSALSLRFLGPTRRPTPSSSAVHWVTWWN